MSPAKSLMFLAALCIATRVLGESGWAYVPHSLDERSIGAFAVPETPTEAAVSFIGTSPARLDPTPEMRRVLAVDVAVGQNDGRPPGESASYAIPDGARWPDSSGRIVAVLLEPGGSQRNAGIRNPWEIRVRSKPVGNDTVFICGGIVVGGEAGPIAILNGHVVRRGDALGKFRVVNVLADGVLLGRSGLFFVLPLGRSTTVATVDG